MVYMQFPAATLTRDQIQPRQAAPQDVWADENSYFDTREFKDYSLRIGTIIDASGRDGITIRAIHEALGFEARREWTLDAIDMLKNIEVLGILPTRYRRI